MLFDPEEPWLAASTKCFYNPGIQGSRDTEIQTLTTKSQTFGDMIPTSEELTGTSSLLTALAW